MSSTNLNPYSLLQSWLKNSGGGFHRKTRFSQDTSGSRIIATDDLEKDVTVVSCPFNKIITKAHARKSVLDVLDAVDNARREWTERQWISTYIALHWIVGQFESQSGILGHFEYLATLPSADQLQTPLHFTQEELALFKGTNLYGATVDRGREWQEEWRECQSFVAERNSEWGKLYTWDKYLTAATYLSSRAFPSTLLSETPTLIGTPSTEPILIPGVDSLNHARGQPVSWVVTHPTKDDSSQESSISLVIHSPTPAGQELFNNYGPKSNSELILGYGFSLPANPDDTIVLKVGGINGKKWEIGRNAQGADGLWKEVLSTLLDPGADPEKATYEDILDSAAMLQEMIQALIERLPVVDAPNGEIIRPNVQKMFYHYIEGQAAILQSLMDFSGLREQEAIDLARQQGINLVLDLDPEEDEDE